MTQENLNILTEWNDYSVDSNHEDFDFKDYTFSESSILNLFLFRKTYNYIPSQRWPDCLEGKTRYNQKFVIQLSKNPDFIHLYAQDIFNHGFGIQPLDKTQAQAIVNEYDKLSLNVFQHRDQSDYIYCRKDFLRAYGKKYQKQRYHINKLLREYDIQCEPISESNVNFVRACLELWVKQINNGFLLDYYECLEGIDMVLEGILKGYCVYLNGKVESFIIYDDSLNKMSVALFQKSNHNYQGLTDYCYKVYCENDTKSTYFNLCQDLGILGLRNKKLMMHPFDMLDKYLVLPA
ncbi:phosphatidylglycerol lysyltransferase domain-containing protein [Saccharicrinis sp. FJH2]|uniref:phosphatidylglycerol lysyltransferase domain-containing protein n=1 Tax=Saccharicrinis sp. FJH65 TaxID=3344659 RepID=UPI0035F37E65